MLKYIPATIISTTQGAFLTKLQTTWKFNEKLDDDIHVLVDLFL